MTHVNLGKQHPAAYKSVLTLNMEVEQAVTHAGLEPKLAELVKIRVSQLNGCAFCLRMHTRDALDKGETTDRLAGEAAHLGQVARDGEDFLPKTLLESALEAIGHAGLELGGGNGQSFETCPRALEERLEDGIISLAFTGGGEANTCSFDGVAIHGPQLSLQSGCRHEDVRT